MRPLYRAGDATRDRPAAPDSPYRTPFRRDYARLLHCPSFRRLQGKTQLFPSAESDFFRNRLTHSLEVPQIAKSIASRLNIVCDYLQHHPIDLDIVETAALAHDLGHPPFGHNGERALNECMRDRGGFEGNAQTLRILAKLEKKEPEPGAARDVPSPTEDRRVGLNLTYRTLAAVLKYDECIPISRRGNDLIKGYYETERHLVERVKENVAGANSIENGFKTIECQIMDIADDIAYSTYDLEDALKTSFVSPMQTISALSSPAIMGALQAKTGLEGETIVKHVMDLWLRQLGDLSGAGEVPSNGHVLEAAAEVYQVFRHLAENGALRTALTSELVNEYVEGVDVDIDDQCPPLSRVTLTYELVISSPNLKTVEYRGSRIVTAVFDALAQPDGSQLLPDDYRARLDDRPAERERTICDFIAGMTDRYALEFYGRLHSEGAHTIFKPL